MSNSKTTCTESEIELRISMLVDNELTATERADLIAMLDKSPNAWRRCAIAFMDEQFLTRAFSTGADPEHEFTKVTDEINKQASNKTAISPASKTTKTRHSLSFGWITLGMLIGLGVGLVGNRLTDADANGIGNRWAGYFGWTASMENEPDNEEELLLASVVSLTNLANEAEELAAHYDLSPKQKTISSTKLVRLYEIQNDENKALYYSPDSIPKFILESMIMAGHNVELTNEQLRTPIGGSEFVELPVFAMRIEKDQNLIHSP